MGALFFWAFIESVVGGGAQAIQKASLPPPLFINLIVLGEVGLSHSTILRKIEFLTYESWRVGYLTILWLFYYSMMLT